jgi:hypothetical protein
VNLIKCIVLDWILLGMDLNAKMLCFNETFVSMSCMKVIQNAWWFFTLQFCCIRFEFLLTFIAILRTWLFIWSLMQLFSTFLLSGIFIGRQRQKCVNPEKFEKSGSHERDFLHFYIGRGYFSLKTMVAAIFPRAESTWLGGGGQGKSNSWGTAPSIHG